MGKEKTCQFCFCKFDQLNHRRTQEHVIPKGLIDLFPEQYISINKHKAYIDNKGFTIADVCSYCNSKLLGRKAHDVQNDMLSARTPEDMELSKTLVEYSIFPENNRIQKIYQKLFNEQE